MIGVRPTRETLLHERYRKSNILGAGNVGVEYTSRWVPTKFLNNLNIFDFLSNFLGDVIKILWVPCLLLLELL
jgi:hypothetical protein